MLEHLALQDILFLDIETVPQHKDWTALPEKEQALWEKKSSYFRERNDVSLEASYQRAGIYAEFGKIVCISIGLVYGQGTLHFKSKSFSGDDEKQLLEEFADLLNSKFSDHDKLLCAHNGKEFDFPYISRRMLIHGVPLPYLLDNAGKKPWEVALLDTMQLWSFGDYKNYTGIALLAHVFNIPTPKDDIDGSDVARVYYEEGDLARIVSYCQKDVLTVAQLFLRFQRKALIEEGNVSHA